MLIWCFVCLRIKMAYFEIKTDNEIFFKLVLVIRFYLYRLLIP